MIDDSDSTVYIQPHGTSTPGLRPLENQDPTPEPRTVTDILRHPLVLTFEDYRTLYDVHHHLIQMGKEEELRNPSSERGEMIYAATNATYTALILCRTLNKRKDQ